MMWEILIIIVLAVLLMFGITLAIQIHNYKLATSLYHLTETNKISMGTFEEKEEEEDE